MDILERFLKYVAIDTTSNPLKEENPSSENQKDLAEILVKELTDLGYLEYEYIGTDLYIMVTDKTHEEMYNYTFLLL